MSLGVIRTHISRVAPHWYLWRTLYRLSYSAAAFWMTLSHLVTTGKVAFCDATELIILATAGIGHSPGWTRRGCRWTATSSWPATVAGNRRVRKWRSRSRSCCCWRRRWSGKRGFPSWRPSALTRCCRNFPSGCLKIKNYKKIFFTLITQPE